MLYWNLERELVEGEPLFFGHNKQFSHPTPPKSTNNKHYAELAKVGNADSQPKKI